MKHKTSLQLSLFEEAPKSPIVPKIPFWWYGWTPKVGDLVHCDFARGKDLISGHDRCYTVMIPLESGKVCITIEITYKAQR